MIKSKLKNTTGFSLVELIVSVAITGIIMVGISAFFSSGFQQMFAAREKNTTLLQQLVTNSILKKALSNANHLSALGGSYAVLQKEANNHPLRFSLLKEEEEHLALKDVLVFNGQHKSLNSQDAVKNVDQPTGITRHKGIYYVAAPLEDAIYQCTILPGNCSGKLDIKGLNQPMDLASDGDFLYVTDSGNNRVLKINKPGEENQVTVLAENLNFPTGIVHYPTVKSTLFVADTGNHQIKKINTEEKTTEVIVGMGEQSECDQTAAFCLPHFPTGLAIEINPNGDHLYIADTGNHRILKISDPGQLDSFDIQASSPDENIVIQAFRVLFPKNVNAKPADLNISSDGNIVQTFGKKQGLNNVFTYRLETELTDNTQDTNSCEEPCVPSKNKIEVATPDLFDTVTFTNLMVGEENTIHQVNNKNGTILNLFPVLSEHQEFGSIVKLLKTIPAGTNIDFEFTNVNTENASGGFNKIEIHFLDANQKLINAQAHYFRMGDGKIGGFEDNIEVFMSDLDFPTDLEFNNGNLSISQQAMISTDFNKWDYTSPNPIKNLNFEEKNNGHLLKVNFETLEEIGGEPVYIPQLLFVSLKE